MIKTKKDYLFYLESDRIALGEKKKKPDLFGQEIWKFLILLRKTEYLTNCKNDIFSKIHIKILNRYRRKLAYKIGFMLPLNSFGPGLSIFHFGPRVINSEAVIGANCRLHECVNIGTTNGSNIAPVIGNNVYIAPGVKIFGDIKIADGIVIGANSVVNRSFLEPNITIAGVPAKKISNNNSEKHLLNATDIVRQMMDTN